MTALATVLVLAAVLVSRVGGRTAATDRLRRVAAAGTARASVGSTRSLRSVGPGAGGPGAIAAGGGSGRREPGGSSSPPIPPGLVADLVAAVLAAGAAPGTAVAVVAEGLAAVGDPGAGAVLDLADRLDRGWPHPSVPVPEGSLTHVEEALALALHTGLAPADLVRHAAADLRRATAARVSAAVARLPVLLVLPVGLCLLPAAVLLGVVPVVLDLLGDVLAGL